MQVLRVFKIELVMRRKVELGKVSVKDYGVCMTNKCVVVTNIIQSKTFT